jgi:16S rRNA processing protein RimM
MSQEWDALVVVGRIARTHGLAGEVVVNVETDFPEDRFRAGQRMFVAPGGQVRQVRIAGVRWHKGRPLVSFEGVGTIEDAEALGRGDLRVPPGELVPLEAGTFFHHDLVGCEVVTEAGEEVGRVVRVEGPMLGSLLVVQGRRGEVLVPLAEHICVRIEPAARRIVVAPPEGLLDLNARERGRA